MLGANTHAHVNESMARFEEMVSSFNELHYGPCEPLHHASIEWNLLLPRDECGECSSGQKSIHLRRNHKLDARKVLTLACLGSFPLFE